jgi:drug/metabolite transporter (DMT)-like permease
MKPMATLAPARTVAAPIDPRLIASLAAVFVIWSSTYLAMRIVVHELPPLLTAAIRFTISGGVMLVLARRSGARLPPLRAWLRVAPIGALLCLGGNGFVSIAETSVSSSGAAVVCATMPLWTGVLGALSGSRPSVREWSALVLGFIGVLVLMGGPSLSGEPLHIVHIILSPVSWAFGSLLARRIGKTDSSMFTAPAMQMLTGGVVLFAVAMLRGERIPTDASAAAWGALGYLIVFGSLIAFTAYSWLLRNARPIVATSYAYVNPILATLIAAAFYGEPLGVTTLIANVLIVGAIVLGMYKPARATISA